MKAPTEIDQLIQRIASTPDVMENEAFQELCHFIKKAQTPSGAFADRGGNPDWYYSFFGFLICKALGLNDELLKLKHFILNSDPPRKRNQIEWSVWVLLRQAFKPNIFFKLKISFRLLGLWMFDRKKTDPVYFAFLAMLILNHFWGWARCISNQIDKLTSPYLISGHSPTSHLAAAICIRNKTELATDDLTEILLKRVHPQGGFVAFSDSVSPDMLSTAVAAYAIERSGITQGTVASDCIGFVSMQFDKGAFLSGDGDPTHDIEYTFYGLLALNSLSEILKKKFYDGYQK